MAGREPPRLVSLADGAFVVQRQSDSPARVRPRDLRHLPRPRHPARAARSLLVLRTMKMGSLVKLFAAGAVAIVVACGGSAEGVGGGSAIAFATSIEPFDGFSYSTGPLPNATSPAQVSLDVRASGALEIEGLGDAAGAKLEGRASSGKLALDVRFAMVGTLKVDTKLPGAPKYNGDLPGLKDISIPLTGELAFDPFLLDGKNADLKVAVPELELPAIPLGTIPGKLRLTVSNKSEIHIGLEGTCVSANGGKGSWDGQVTPSGTLVLRGAIALDFPGAPGPIDLGEIAVPIAVSSKTVEIPAKDTVPFDFSAGTCDAPPSNPDASTPDSNAPDATKPDAGGDAGDGGPTVTCPLTATCPGTSLGTIRGDVGTEVLVASGQGAAYFTVHVDEGSKESLQMRIQADLQYDQTKEVGATPLSLFSKPGVACSGNVLLRSGKTTASTFWADTTANEDARDIIIRVLPIGAGACTPWTLRVHR